MKYFTTVQLGLWVATGQDKVKLRGTTHTRTRSEQFLRSGAVNADVGEHWDWRLGKDMYYVENISRKILLYVIKASVYK
jgi:hypothetical protein